MTNDKIRTARVESGQFFKDRREEMGHSQKTVADDIGITVNTLTGIETGRFAWDIDLHLRICQALEIKPYFSTLQYLFSEDYRLRKEDDPERYHGFYIAENLLLYPGSLQSLSSRIRVYSFGLIMAKAILAVTKTGKPITHRLNG